MQEEPKKSVLTGTARLDATTEAAYAIIDKRVQDRDRKTIRLKELRLAREATDLAARAGAPAKKSRRGKSQSSYSGSR